ncbi:MAG: glutamate--tRNA ligase [Planctomycetaceae bacterium]|nr:glutamate--tRNA ligase [Planctomycetaceae bacterium]
MTVRTRFAPSPTGYMHIGGMRTALFNWLFARHNGGKFILRIDDTDQQRNLDAALGPILDAFRWLGLDWDEGPEVGGDHGPYFQSQRGEFYKRAVTQLLESGAAYQDFETPDEIKVQREAAQAEKRTYLSSRVSLQLSPAERANKAAAGDAHVIRLLVDRQRKVSVEDHVRGHVEWDCGLMADPVICRSDGSPLYNFATVVDDIALQISHVIRAEEHLTNTAVQLLIYDALGAKTPEFAHIPFVAAPGTTKKLSKREIGKYRNNPQFKKLFDIADQILPAIGQSVSDAMNPVMVSFYEEVGFLPEAVLNALSRLGWSYDDKTENMPLDFVVQNFSLERVVKGPAGLDCDKLLAYQEHWMGQLPLEQKVEQCLPYLVKAKRISEPVDAAARAFVARLVTALGERLKLFGDIVQYSEYFVADDILEYDEKAFDKRLTQDPAACGLLRGFRDRLAGAEPFDAATLESLLNAYVTERGVGLGAVIHALRVAVTGKAAGPGMFDCLALVGRERCVSRIDRALQRVN